MPDGGGPSFSNEQGVRSEAAQEKRYISSSVRALLLLLFSGPSPAQTADGSPKNGATIRPGFALSAISTHPVKGMAVAVRKLAGGVATSPKIQGGAATSAKIRDGPVGGSEPLSADEGEQRRPGASRFSRVEGRARPERGARTEGQPGRAGIGRNSSGVSRGHGHPQVGRSFYC